MFVYVCLLPYFGKEYLRLLLHLLWLTSALCFIPQAKKGSVATFLLMCVERLWDLANHLFPESSKKFPSGTHPGCLQYIVTLLHKGEMLMFAKYGNYAWKMQWIYWENFLITVGVISVADELKPPSFCLWYSKREMKYLRKTYWLLIQFRDRDFCNLSSCLWHEIRIQHSLLIRQMEYVHPL